MWENAEHTESTCQWPLYEVEVLREVYMEEQIIWFKYRKPSILLV